jgi:hypothetical protein
MWEAVISLLILDYRLEIRKVQWILGQIVKITSVILMLIRK